MAAAIASLSQTGISFGILTVARMCSCSGGLASTAVVNIAFGMGSAYWWFLTFWGLNGVLQVR